MFIQVPLFDETLFILKEVYLNADTWLMQRQILSIIVKDMDYNEVKQVRMFQICFIFNIG
jgi:hypothetical protein